MPQRFADQGQSIAGFASEFLVRCPRCGARALVRGAPPTAARPASRAAPRLTCPACGYAQDWRPPARWVPIITGPQAVRSPPADAIIVGGAFDWYFHQPLWLQTPCVGHTLWAYNAQHLEFLEQYVAAELRERRPNVNRSLASRLPRWMLEAKHRSDVLSGLRRLRALLTS
jgi:hypothetical protein